MTRGWIGGQPNNAMNAQSLEDARTVRVLLVEDDEDDYLLTREMLEDVPFARYRIDWVSDFDTGLARLEGAR